MGVPIADSERGNESRQSAGWRSKKDFGRRKNLITLDSGAAQQKQIGLRLCEPVLAAQVACLSAKQHLPLTRESESANLGFSQTQNFMQVKENMYARQWREEFAAARWEMGGGESILWALQTSSKFNLLAAHWVKLLRHSVSVYSALLN